MDNEEEKTGASTDQTTSTEATPADGQSLFEKNPALKTVAGVAGVAVFLLAAIALRNNYLENRLQGTGADASCYGYNCQPSVIIGGRALTGGYSNPFSYGTLTTTAGPIELTWYGTNVDRCVADWTDFAGTYYPPTPYPTKLSRNQNFRVTCFRGRTKVHSNLRVEIIRNVGPGSQGTTELK